MNEKESFGIELELIINKFKQKASEANGYIKHLSKQMQEKSTFNMDTSYARRELESLEDYYIRINKYDGLDFNLNESNNEFNDFNKELKNTDKELNRVSNTSKKVDSDLNNIGKSFDKGIKSTKRFGWSLLGLHSGFMLLSRARTTLIQEDDYMRAQSEVTGSVMANSLAPAIKLVADVTQYAAIGFARLLQFFTGVNVLSNVTTKNINKTSNAAKSLNKVLGGFDEINNLDNSSGLIGSGIANDLKALDDFNKKIKEVDDWIKELSNTTIGKLLKGALDTFKELPLPLQLAIGFGGYALTKAFLSGIAGLPQMLMSKLAGTSLGGSVSAVPNMGIVLSISAIIGVTLAWKMANDLDELFQKNNEIIYNSIKQRKDCLKKYIDDVSNLSTEERKKYEQEFSNLADYSKRINDNIVDKYNKTSWHFQLFRSEILNNLDAVWLFNDELYEHAKTQDATRFEIAKTITSFEEERDSIEKVMKRLKESDPEYQVYQDRLKDINKMTDTLNATLKLNDNALESNIDFLIKNGDKLKVNGEQYQDCKEEIIDYMKEMSGIPKDVETVLNLDTPDAELKRYWEELKKTPVEKRTDVLINGIANTDKAEKDFGNFFSKIGASFGKVADTVASDGFNLKSIWGGLKSVWGGKGFAKGLDYVPFEGYYHLHPGETVVPAGFTPEMHGLGNNNEEVVNAIYRLIETVQNKDMNTYISKNAIGEAARSYQTDLDRYVG